VFPLTTGKRVFGSKNTTAVQSNRALASEEEVGVGRFENMVMFVGVIVVSACALADDAPSTREIHRAAAKMSSFATGGSFLSVDCEIRTV
jgi:hypothetical protein